MKIVFTGGGSGGHFYPIIGIAEAIREESKKNKILEPTLYFISPDPYNQKMLYDQQIVYKRVSAGKIRRYFSVMNVIDLFKTALGIIEGLWTVFWIYPDVIFSKGGYGSFPVILAGRILGIPIIVHESDSAPGKVNAWAGKFADKIAVSYPDSAQYFPESKVAWTGNPIRKEIAFASREGAYEYLNLEPGVPVILVLGGSQGARIINESIISSLSHLIEKYQIIHQTGKNNFKEVKETSDVVLDMSSKRNRYKPFPYLDSLALKMAAGAADLIITRAGSTIFEVANWGKPSIVIPISNSNEDHQRKNAYNYARSGACTVIEEANLEPRIFNHEIERIIGNKELQDKMIAGAKSFAKPNAAETIAEQIVKIGLTHES